MWNSERLKNLVGSAMIGQNVFWYTCAKYAVFNCLLGDTLIRNAKSVCVPINMCHEYVKVWGSDISLCQI